MSGWDFLPEIISTPLEPLSLVALLAAIYLYSNLSRRLGAVTKMAPYYHWFYLLAWRPEVIRRYCYPDFDLYIFSNREVRKVLPEDFSKNC